MKCTVCNHSQRQDIDQALLGGNATYAALSQQYGLSVSALFRHKKLLKLKMAQVEKDLQRNLRQGCLFKFNDSLEQVRQLARTAGAEGNIRQALQAVRVGTRILNFITKLDVQLDQDTVYRVLASPQWAAQDSLLPTDSKIITDAHQALADDLFFPCQELPAALEDELKKEEISEISPLQTRNPELETLPKIQREISAKLPKKTPRSEQNHDHYQKDSSSKNNSTKNSHLWRTGASPVPEETSPPPKSSAPGTDAVGTQPVNSCPESPPAAENRKLEIVTKKLKTFFQRCPKPVSTKNRKPKTKNRLLPNPVLGPGSWFQKLAAKCRPGPPPAPYEEECEILFIKKTDRWCRGIY